MCEGVVCARTRARVRVCVCVCTCACVRMFVNVCVHAFVRTRVYAVFILRIQEYTCLSGKHRLSANGSPWPKAWNRKQPEEPEPRTLKKCKLYTYDLLCYITIILSGHLLALPGLVYLLPARLLVCSSARESTSSAPAGIAQ